MKSKYFILLLMGLLFFTAARAQGATSNTGSNIPASMDQVPGINVVLVSQTPDPVNPGDTVDLRFRIDNIGGAAVTNLNYQLVTSYPFLPVDGQEYNVSIPLINGYQQTNEAGTSGIFMDFKVRLDKDATEGVSSIQLKQTQAFMQNIIWSFAVRVQAKEFAQIIRVDKSVLNPGRESNLTFTIYNTGSSPITNMVFSWNEPKGVILPIYSDNTKYVKYLDVGQSVDLQYSVVPDVNAVAGLYQLNLNLAFQTIQGNKSSIVTSAGVLVGGETDFDVTFSQSSAGQTTLSVANIGNNPAYSVTVSIPQQSQYSVTGSSSSIIGNLDKGDYTVVSFNIAQGARRNFTQQSGQTQLPQQTQQASGLQASQGTQGFRQEALAVNVDYTDSLGVRHSVEKAVPIQFTASTTTTTTRTRSSSIFSSPIAIIAGIVIIGGIVFFVVRKRAGSKKRKSD